jgi:nucleoid-associated protein YgaU
VKKAVLAFAVLALCVAPVALAQDYDALKREVKMNEGAGEGKIQQQTQTRIDDAARLNKEAEGVEFENKALEGKVMKVQKVHDFWKNIIGEDQAFLAKYKEGAPMKGQHVVVEGECLWMISGMEYGHPYYYKWPLIYNANRELIKDPDLIYPGWNLKIPPMQ